MSSPKTDARVEWQWNVRIPLRDGITLSAIVYRPHGKTGRGPCIVSMTPYIAEHLHDRGHYFAARGFTFVAVDVRGRGNSEGEMRPLIQEASDGFDVVEWVGHQPYCNGKVAMYGGSYLGFVQWATAGQAPPSLAAVAPACAPYAGVDYPIMHNMFRASAIRWLTLVSGRASQMKLNSDINFWYELYRRWHESGVSLRKADVALGHPSLIFQEWLCHPEPDKYWDAHNPTPEQYARLQIPILITTGFYDGHQAGTLQHYRLCMRHASAQARSRIYLVIGPWNHPGVGTPSAEFEGIRIGAAGVLDMYKLHAEWYAWTLLDGPKPEFLRNQVAYYVMGAEEWCYADSLDSITADVRPLYLHASGDATDVFSSGSLLPVEPGDLPPNTYIYDPRDVSRAALEASLDYSRFYVDQRLVLGSGGKQLVYHTRPLEQDLEIGGFFRLSAWISIDQPDTDFRASIYEIDVNGASVLLTEASLRARYREDVRQPKLIRTRDPLQYEFEHFTFVSRLVRAGCRLRLVIGPINSVWEEKNYNSGGVVAEESMQDARSVTVTVFHDREHATVLHVPVGRAELRKYSCEKSGRT